jgi:uncharacterized protein YdeI (YjbR/CyaY-like superfamily)
MQKVHSVEEYIKNHSQYNASLSKLRSIIRKTELEETIKWNMPTYCLNGKNVLGIGAFKTHFCLWFHNGVFLKDQDKLLINAQENKTKALRQMRFKSIEDINEAAVLVYVKEAIKNQRAGKYLSPKKVTKKVTKKVVITKELKSVLDANKTLLNSFKNLTPGKQREYCEYIDTAKQEATKQKRLEKIIPLIFKGVGLHDKYKNC